MKYQDLSLGVGKRDLDDKKQVSISGRLIKPDTRSDILLIVSTGFLGKHPDYFEHFGKLLGEEFNVYITEHGRKGFSKGTTLKRDFLQIDTQARDRAETDKVIYMSRIEFSKTRYFSGKIQKTQFLSMLKNQPLSRQPL